MQVLGYDSTNSCVKTRTRPDPKGSGLGPGTRGSDPYPMGSGPGPTRNPKMLRVRVGSDPYLLRKQALNS